MLQRKKTSTTQSNIIARPVLQKYFCLFLISSFFYFYHDFFIFCLFCSGRRKAKRRATSSPELCCQNILSPESKKKKVPTNFPFLASGEGGSYRRGSSDFPAKIQLKLQTRSSDLQIRMLKTAKREKGRMYMKIRQSQVT